MNFTSKAIAAYAIAINGLSFALFGADKSFAKAGQYRIPEKALHLTALAGGAVGGVLAMNTFRHKTKKTSFRVPYFTCVAANALGIALLCVHPGARAHANKIAGSFKKL